MAGDRLLPLDTLSASERWAWATNLTIGLKIFGIAVGLVILIMAAVALLSIRMTRIGDWPAPPLWDARLPEARGRNWPSAFGDPLGCSGPPSLRPWGG